MTVRLSPSQRRNICHALTSFIPLPPKKNIRDDEISEETREEDGTHDEYDQDSRISFDDDDDGSTASEEDNLEDWIEHGKKESRKKPMNKC